ncbi:alpha-1,2-Mannosidase [Venustampulla echinocandica]|uniref:alpha-1,2-Mannosidase n=1 Tax=Venustampulla echinocandica TaxID=2656787 RepID=A0A370TTE5_9HELO|nr:alpha-1,2-Mannosidase [Venustampulla echinocandica]RDL38774.1 alpha-1,2-Mannosidase [Venustampulla echinocandica]
MAYKDKDSLSIHVRGFDDSFVTSAMRRTPTQRILRLLGLTFFVVGCVYFFRDSFFQASIPYKIVPTPIRPERFPVSQPIPLPRGRAKKLPKIQHAPVAETKQARKVREHRLGEVRSEFLHAWRGYKKEAWAKDELKPINGGYKTPFCGWAATLVDTLDTLWIMELYDEFELALAELKNIDFTHKEGCQINLFETTIRHLGGMIAAFDLSDGQYPILIEKSVELAEVLYTAFDTPNRMPSPHYLWSATNPDANDHFPSSSIVLAVLGSLSVEFTRLAQITGNDKYFDAIQRVMNELEKWQDNTGLPGMWPAMVDSTKINQTIALGSPFEGGDELYTLGALADSTYEYLPKQYMLLGGQSASYRTMYEKFIEVAQRDLFFRPMTVAEDDILISGAVNRIAGKPIRLNPELQHLACFTGGMVAIAGKLFNRPEDVADGARLASGCVWAYENTVSGIMPETFTTVPCKNRSKCPWNTKTWLNAIDSAGNEEALRDKIRYSKVAPGMVAIQDGRYLLRPEAIESVFILHRITADPQWAESGWKMFKAIQAHTKTEIAHSAIENVMESFPEKVDEMESFWLAETLKYFYLLYSKPSVVNLDEYVLNTEAHPLKRP